MNIEREISELKMIANVTQNNLKTLSLVIKNHEQRLKELVGAINQIGQAQLIIQELLVEYGTITKDDIEAKRVALTEKNSEPIASEKKSSILLLKR